MLGDNLPNIVVVEDGYYTDGGVWTQFLADETVVIVGARPAGETVGEYRKTRNASNADLGPGSYAQVVDSLQTGTPIPRRISVHRGQNGGPVIYYPSAVVVMSV
jgi:hypothetical protein